MKISYNWLKDYINPLPDPEKTSEILTNIGLEVENIEESEGVKGGLKGIVIGEVLSCERHPNADKLSLTRVDVGQEEQLHIVCGAPNVKAGQKVAVALVGATIYKGEESLTLKKSKIRGEVSEGMICAEDEMGLGDDHEGIMVLDPDAQIGTPAAEYFNIHSDTIFEIGLTPNRIDGASHYGVARDLAAYLKQHGKVELKRPSVDDFKADNNKKPFKIIIENEEACRRYSGLSISNLNIGPSPDWLQQKLMSIGLKPINNVVDITNFVLHETGQPLHAFDADEIQGSKVIIKTLAEGTKFKTLDEEERILSSEDLMICNENEGMCIAGVFGGMKSGVKTETHSIFLESACFNPVYVRKTSKRHLLFTDSSFRFERGSDPEITTYALKRAALLLKEIAGGVISSDIIDIYPGKQTELLIKLEISYLNKLVGKVLPHDQVVAILTSLDFVIKEQTPEYIFLQVPSYRVDVSRPADVVEEILRIYGYNRIEIPNSVHSTLTYIQKPDSEKLTHLVSELLTANGFNEMMSNSLTKSSWYETKTEPDPELVRILNPLSSDLNCMRKTLIFGGLETISYNSNRKNHDLKLYEFGNIYSINTKDKSENKLNKYIERKNLAVFMSGKNLPENWLSDDRNVTIYDIKAIVNLILSRLGFDMHNMEMKEISNRYFIEGLSLLNKNKEICSFGKINPQLNADLDINAPLFCAEFNWSLILQHYNTEIRPFQPVSKFPEVRRDLSMVLEKNIKFEDIRRLAMKTEGRSLKRVTIFDVYEGNKIEAGKKSYALTFVLQDENKTLTDQQIDKIMDNIARKIEKEFGAQIRVS